MKYLNYKYHLIIILSFLVGCSTFRIEDYGDNLGKIDYAYGRVLLVTAHQDDEVFIASRLLQHIFWKDTVYIVWTASGQKDSVYQNIRKRESIEGCQFLGIDTVNCYFLDYIDGETYKHLNEIYKNIANKIREIRPKVIYTPAFEGGHIDHDITHFVTVKAAYSIDSTITVYEYPEYSAYQICFSLPFKMRNFPRKFKTDIRELTQCEFDKIIALWNIYESQLFPLHLYVSLVSGTKRTFGYEYLRKIPMYDYAKLRHYYGDIGYERYLWGTSYADFLNAINGFTPN